MSVSLAYDDTLSRVRITADGLTSGTVTVDRSTDQIRWVPVRGGIDLTPVGGAVSVDDYEFAADTANYYRVDGQVASITPHLGGVWLKSVARPFLNRRVNVYDVSDISRPSRAGLFEVVGRTFPVAVTDVRGSRRWTLQLYTVTETEATELNLALASGDILFLHVPRTGPMAAVPAGYFAAGDTSEALFPTDGEPLRIVSIECTEVAPPGPDVVGATLNWQTVLNAYPTWADVLAAHETWADLLELIGSPTDVVVS